MFGRCSIDFRQIFARFGWLGETWVCMEMFGQEEEQVVDDEQLDAVVERLNEEALKQLEDPKSEMSKAVQSPQQHWKS